MTLLPRLHLSLPPRAQPSGLTSAKCVLKRGEGPFHHPTPPQLFLLVPPPPLLCLLPLCPLSLSHSARWQDGGIIVTRAGFMESGPMAKTKRHLSIPAGNTPPPPPPFTGVHGLIRYALIRHIDHRRASISPESSHGTFTTSKAEKKHGRCSHLQRSSSGGGGRGEGWRRTIVAKAPEGCQSLHLGGTMKSRLSLPCRSCNWPYFFQK